MLAELEKLGVTVVSTGKKVTEYIELFVEGDENDADYVSCTNTLTLDEFKEILPILRKIDAYDKSGKDCNWENNSDYLTEDEIDLFSEYKPYGNSDNDIHSIEDISVWYVNGDVRKVLKY